MQAAPKTPSGRAAPRGWPRTSIRPQEAETEGSVPAPPPAAPPGRYCAWARQRCSQPRRLRCQWARQGSRARPGSARSSRAVRGVGRSSVWNTWTRSRWYRCASSLEPGASAQPGRKGRCVWRHFRWSAVGADQRWFGETRDKSLLLGSTLRPP